MGGPTYPDTAEQIRTGDRIAFGDRTGRIVIVTDADQFAPDFPKSEWSFVRAHTIAVKFDDGQLMMFDSFCSHDAVRLLSRDSA
jgi:hypothetical protein